MQAAHTFTITALGDQTVTNNAYSGPAATTAPFNQKTIMRHYGFGGTAGTVALVGTDGVLVPSPASAGAMARSPGLCLRFHNSLDLLHPKQLLQACGNHQCGLRRISHHCGQWPVIH